MQQVNYSEYINYRKENKNIKIGKNEISLTKRQYVNKVKPEYFKMEIETVWSFPSRGTWATHRFIPLNDIDPMTIRNLIMRYSQENDIVLDPMTRSGATIIECRCLNRKGIGVNLNYDSIILAHNRADFELSIKSNYHLNNEYKLYKGDVRDLNLINNETIDLIITKLPSIKINKRNYIQNDISNIRQPSHYYQEVEKISVELNRILKNDKYCILIVKDVRDDNKKLIPVTFNIINHFIKNKFEVVENIIKMNWHNKNNGNNWDLYSIRDNFFMINHEYIYVLKKIGNVTSQIKKENKKEEIGKIKTIKLPFEEKSDKIGINIPIEKDKKIKEEIKENILDTPKEKDSKETEIKEKKSKSKEKSNTTKSKIKKDVKKKKTTNSTKKKIKIKEAKKEAKNDDKMYNDLVKDSISIDDLVKE